MAVVVLLKYLAITHHSQNRKAYHQGNVLLTCGAVCRQPSSLASHRLLQFDLVDCCCYCWTFRLSPWNGGIGMALLPVG